MWYFNHYHISKDELSNIKTDIYEKFSYILRLDDCH